MDNIFKEWKEALSDFKGSVEKDLKEIRRHKEEVRQMRAQLLDHYWGCNYIRDDNRLILSAPEIIIGNVDPSGAIIGSGHSSVVLRGKNIKINGISPTGCVETHAPRILQIAEDTGIDGEENVVGPVSEIISQGKTVVIQANEDSDLFSSRIKANINGGIRLQADNIISLEAAPEADTKKAEIENTVSSLSKFKSDVNKEVDNSKKRFEDLIKKLEDIIKEYEKLFDSEDDARTNIGDIIDKNKEIKNLTPGIIDAFEQYSKNVSRLAEATRKINTLKKHKDKIKTGSEYKDNPLGSLIRLSSENINLISSDAERNFRDNDGAGISLTGNVIKLSSVEKDGSLKEKGSVNIQAMNINVAAKDKKNLKFNNGQLTGGDYEAKGKINISAKDITLESMDYEVKDSKIEEKALTKEGKINIRTESFEVSSNDVAGKAVGSISLNSKSIDIKSMDVDKEKKTDKNLSEGSSMVLISDKMFIGGKDKNTQSKLVQTSSDTVGIFAETTIELQQGEKKGILQMNGGTVALSGDKTELYGKTTVNGATEFKAEIKAPKAEIDSVNAKSAFKSPNISDGMAAGGGGGGGSLSAKLEKEEAPKQESEKK